MRLSLDHLVILVFDLEAAMADYQALGFTVQRGGTHADGSTHNALIGFEDGSYLELIAFLKPSPQHRWAPAAARGLPGLIDFALLPLDVGTVVAAAQARGLAYQGPVDGGRLRPDGAQLRWQIGNPPLPGLPFLCGDVTERTLRVPEGSVRQHANGVQGVATLTLAVADVAASLNRYLALLGPDALRSPLLPVAGLGLQQATVALGPSTLVLLGLGPDDSAPAHQALRNTLATRGEGLMGLTLARSQAAAAVALPAARTHGVAMDLVPVA